MLEILEKITAGKGAEKDLSELEYLASWTKKGSLCGLGKSAPNPVLSTLKYFREEYLAHLNGKCPAGKCPDLIKYQINDLCIGCTKCAQKCPTEAILFKPHLKHEVIAELCIKCNACKEVCPVEAVDII
jgi:NADH-quinone oxidoreductase subunit F